MFMLLIASSAKLPQVMIDVFVHKIADLFLVHLSNEGMYKVGV